jgi:acyl-CoA thioesterase FadM
VVLAQEIRRGDAGGELLVSGTIRAACVDTDSLRPRPLPAALAASS